MSKEEKYQVAIQQIAAVTEGEHNLIANLANAAAILKENLKCFWVGFYLVDQEHLILGPFQGPAACTRIPFGKGVCGKAWEQKKSIVVPNVREFPGHIACNAKSKSEIVVPVIKNEKVSMVLDIDSDKPDAFNAVDQKYIEEITSLISGWL